MFQSVTKMQKALESAHKRTQRAREKTAETIETALHAAESFGVSLALGVWEGKIEDKAHFEIGGVPAPLAFGAAGLGLALMGIGRGMEGHLKALSVGALCAHGNGIGRKMGQNWKATGSLVGPKVSGEISGAGLGGTGVSQADLVNLANA